MILLAIDPGTDTGWARFTDGQLEACGLGKPPIGHIYPDEVVIERPEYRKHDRINPDVLIEIAIKVGRLVERCAAVGIAAALVRPMEWKGSVPKKIHHPRIGRALEVGELELLDSVCSLHAKSIGHNVWDAVGLGLWFLGRLPR